MTRLGAREPGLPRLLNDKKMQWGEAMRGRGRGRPVWELRVCSGSAWVCEEQLQILMWRRGGGVSKQSKLCLRHQMPQASSRRSMVWPGCPILLQG